MGDVPLNVNFALSEPPLGTAAVLISAFTKFDEYSICIAMISVEYEITNIVHYLNWGVWMIYISWIKVDKN